MIKEFYAKYKNILLFISVLIVVYLLYFHNLWAYRLLDVDETRYVDMARYMHKTKDFMTLYLNGNYFFEKPPLYFWLENLSFYLFNSITEFTARIPSCLSGILAGITLFWVTKKYTQNLKLAVISSLILLSSAEFVILSKIAILDIFLASTVTIAILLGFLTFSVKPENKKFCWWGFYLFTALAVLAKGIPGIAIPFGTMFFVGIYSKKFKEFFKPQYFLVGLFLFFLVALPWHIIMLQKYDPLFFNEYIIKHHIARFLGAEVIHRQQPFWFFIPVIICGILPFASSFISLIVEKCGKLKGFTYKTFSQLDTRQQFINLSIIASLVTFLFFSSSGTKLVTYIVPIYPYLAVILGNYWLEYIENNEHEIGIKISTLIFNIIFIIAGIGFTVSLFFIAEPVKSDLLTICVPVTITAIFFPIWGLLALKKDKKIQLFASYLLLMTFLSGFGFHKILEMNYRFGENDLIEYAKYAKDNNLKINTYRTGARYSVLYYSNSKANFDIDEKDFAQTIDTPNNIMIVRKKHYSELPDKDIQIIKEGRKYLLIKK